MLFKLIALSFIAFLSGCSSSCGNRIIDEVSSPNGMNIATIFERNCGATTSYVQAIIIRDRNSNFNGNNVDDFIFTMKGQEEVKVKWLGDNRLVVIRPEKTKDIYIKLSDWEDFKIDYTTPNYK
ncbi:DUF5412 family protein [Hahella aquimaris]|uniref:DUF5412 family protein n=1 Tax=Hahella sp. HNIBRBA332 TaxID=3015983 RepID=UPI00273AD894|nr:DUF5412 family protein [Hahella sp. HNIBRBA332]WLQ11866.1 DUF5412 family protein [Hahella sp. HNIBRBA332]